MGRRFSFIMTGRPWRKKIDSPFAQIEQHILLPWATEIAQAAKVGHERLTEPVLREIVELIPATWLEAIPGNVPAAETARGLSGVLCAEA